MTNYKLVPVELLRGWHKRINTIAADTAFDVADEMESILAAAPAVQGEPAGYVSPRHLEMLRSGKACGVTMEDRPDERNGVTVPLYTAPQPASDTTLLEAFDAAQAEVHRLREWIKETGDQLGMCTYNIQGEVCDGCRCKQGGEP